MLRRTASLVRLDPAVRSALAYRTWQAVAGLITILLVSRWMSPEMQGGYYAFASLLALHSLSDLGLFVAVTSVAGHEYAHLRWEGRALSGADHALSRLGSLGRQLVAWYGLISLLSTTVVAAGGTWFFAATLPNELVWHGPWLVLVATAGLSLWVSPLIALLEGCGRIVVVNRFRLVFGVMASVVAWTVLIRGFGLWVLPALALVQLLRDCVLILVYHPLFVRFLRRPLSARVSWKSEVWPMQWRLGVQGVFQFTATQLFAPILLYYHGPIAAGQFGMTWSLVSGVQTLTLASIHAQLPALALLAGRRETAALEHLWRRSSFLAVGGLTVAGAGLLAAVVVAVEKQPALAGRMLGPLLTAALIAGVCCAQVVQCLATYVRAHKQEFLAPAGIAYSVTAAVLGWALGRRFGAAGVVSAYLTATAVVALPIAAVLWNRFRQGQARHPVAAEARRDRSG